MGLLACVCAWGASPPDTNSTAAQAVINSCVARIGDDASADVLQQCPRVPAALRALGYDQLLGSGWEARLSGISLRDLRDLSRRYQGPALSRAPSPAELPQILQEMRRDQPPRSWWQSFKERLRRWFQLPSSEGGAPWLVQLLSAVPPLVLRLLLYCTTAAVVVVALWTIWRELLASGVLERGRGQAVAATPDSPVRGLGSAELAAMDLESVPPGQRAAVLLQLLLQALRRAGRVRAERALSCRELIEQASFDSLGQRQRFATVARWAERERYAVEAARSEPPAVLDQGRALYAELLVRRSAEAHR
jgi:hypothetical protein